MVSVSLAEILTIALIVLIVFGPRRLPEISRKAGRILRDLRAAAAELKAGIEAEAEDVESALGDVRRSLGATQGDDSESRGGPDSGEMK